MLWFSSFYPARELWARALDLWLSELGLEFGVWGFQSSHFDGWVPGNLPCLVLLGPSVLTLVLSCFIVSARSVFPGFFPRKLSAVQVVRVAKACPTFDIQHFSLYLIVHHCWNALAIVCSAPLWVFGNYPWVPRDLASFQKVLSLEVGGEQTTNGMWRMLQAFLQSPFSI